MLVRWKRGYYRLLHTSINNKTHTGKAPGRLPRQQNTLKTLTNFLWSSTKAVFHDREKYGHKAHWSGARAGFYKIRTPKTHWSFAQVYLQKLKSPIKLVRC